MKKGKVISLAVSHKNLNHIFRTGDTVNENDVSNFDKLVKTGHIKEDQKKIEEKKTVNKKAE